jgi:Undecaprenyl-phosphate glucose phosphotransferase
MEHATHSSGRHLIKLSSRDRLLVASDLVPPLDFIAVLFAAYLSSLLYSLFPSDTAALMSFGINRSNMTLLAATLAPFILYNPEFATAASRRHTRALVRFYLLRAMCAVAVVFAIGAATNVIDNLPTQWLLSLLGLSVVLTVTTRALAAKHVRTLQGKGALTESIAVVGAGPVADKFDRHLRQTQAANVQLVGVFDEIKPESSKLAVVGDAENIAATRASTSTWPVHSLERLIELSQSRPIDWIVITVQEGEEERMRALVERLNVLSVPIALCPENVRLQASYKAVDYVGNGMPVLLLADRPIKRWNAILKSVEDAVLGWLIAAMLLPVFAVIALAIRIDSPGPIIFRQKRHAFNNTEFDIYKFRTMRWQPEGSGTALQQTRRNDQRITRLGRWLRETSLDELPQLFNVLAGEMSLIGPRPHAVNMRTEDRLGWEITDRYAHRHRVKPGMTGWSQVNGARGATDTIAQLQRRVELDLHYIEHWSLWLDLKILFMTFWTVLKKTNAY